MTITMGIDGGVGKLNALLKTVMFRSATNYHKGLQNACDFILEESRKIVPYDTGFLHSTGYTIIHGSGWFAKGDVGYHAYYALIVHEKVWANFKGGKQAKYLESTINRHQKTINDLIRKPMERL